MNSFYEIEITITGKAFGPKREPYQTFQTLTERVPNLKTARAYIKDRYGSCKRNKMYIEDVTGNPHHIGYVYCFRDDYERCFRQDWVTVSHLTSEEVII